MVSSILEARQEGGSIRVPFMAMKAFASFRFASMQRMHRLDTSACADEHFADISCSTPLARPSAPIM
eukprot:2784429-Pleurochrysis_carterae.AAC.3